MLLVELLEKFVIEQSLFERLLIFQFVPVNIDKLISFVKGSLIFYPNRITCLVELVFVGKLPFEGFSQELFAYAV